MSSNSVSVTEGEKDRLDFWRKKWETNQIGFHNKEVHYMLIKYADRLFKDGSKPSRIFVPLCGKTLDMKWLADQGITVVGLDGVQSALEQFYSEHALQWEQSCVPDLGQGGALLSNKDQQIKLYCGDMLEFSSQIEGTFDAIWERGSLSALKREDVKKYIEVIKDLLNPGGRILMEVTEYDVSIMDDLNRPTKPPPPYPITEGGLKDLFEPHCSVQFLERDGSKLAGKDIHLAMYLITKQ